MKRKIGVVAVTGLLASALFATLANAQCTPAPNYPGVMIVFNNDAWAYETAYTPGTHMSASGSQLTVVGMVSVFCSPFADLNPLDPTTEYTFIWDGLNSLGTTSKPYGLGGTQWTTKYVGGGFRIYADSPRNAPTAATLPALPDPGVVPDEFVDGTMILGGVMDTLFVIFQRNSLGNFSGSFQTNYQCTGGALYSRVGSAANLLSGAWCPATPPPPPPGLALQAALAIGQCDLPVGWSAHPNGKWDTPITVPVTPSTWGKIKTLYR
jgi:hypothetical protein